MDSYAGYRGTSPPNVFVAFDKAQLDMDSGLFVRYEDPLDLKNTFVSWDYGFDGGNKGLGKLVLINPGTQIEDKLFSWYAALAPRSWTATERGYTKSELEERCREVADFYVRWGYQSPANLASGGIPSGGYTSVDNGALSHIHKFRLLDMGYRISDKGDKIITLTLVNMWELYYNTTKFVQRERMFEVPLTDANGVCRPPSTIVQEFLLQFNSAHEQYKGYSKWTDGMFESLNADFDLLLKAKSNDPKYKPAQATLPVNAQDLYVKYSEAKSLNHTAKENWAVMGALQEFYGQFGMVPSFKVPKPKTPAPQKTPSPNQGKGAPDQGTPENPNPTAVQEAENKVVANTDLAMEVIINDPITVDNNPLAMAMNYLVPGSPIPMSPPAGVPYLMVYRDKNDIAKTEVTLKQISAIRDTNKFWYAVHPVFQSLVQDKPWSQAQKYLAWSQMWPPPNTSVLLEGESGLNEYPLGDCSSGDFVDCAIEVTKNAIIAKEEEAIAELHAANKVEAEQAAQAETMQHLQDLGVYEPEDDDAEEFLPHTIQFMSKNLKLDVDVLIAYLNDKYFKGTSRYLQSGQLEFANVPNANRPEVEKILGGAFEGMDWEEDNGLLLMTDSNEMSEIFSFAMEDKGIKSFPIQSNTRPNTISISTGFNSRPDNIITNLNWSINQGSMFLEIRNTPMVVQKLYNVAKRFEDPEYRDVVTATLALELHFENAKDGVLTNDGNGAGGIAAPELNNQKDAVGAEVFPNSIIESAQAQATTMTSFDSDSQDGADISESSRADLIETVRQDLRFITDKGLTDIFFPKVGDDAQDSIRTRYFISNPQGQDDVKTQKVVPYFRYVTKSPITILQKKLEAQGLAATTENSVLTQAKVQALNIFQKLITDIKIEMLGVPEMDIWTNEIQNRSVALWVHEPRVPGTYHWLTGMYTIADFNHRIDGNGYATTLTLLPKLPNTAEEMSKFTFLKIGGTE